MSNDGKGCQGYLPISSYALIGNCHTAVLVSRNGSMDWFCPGRFDAPAVFCRLLDARNGGYWSISPAGDFSVKRRYAGSTNILETTFSCGDGRIRLTDLMPVHQRRPGHRGYDVASSRRILRHLEGLDGEVDLEMRFRPTFDYGRAETHLSLLDQGAVAKSKEDLLVLSAPRWELSLDAGGCVVGKLTVRKGDRHWVALSEAEGDGQVRQVLTPSSWHRMLDATRRYWEQWAATSSYRGKYRNEVIRSALTLKMLTYEPSGAIVAAPTTSLPEEIGGVRNWDYRFSWLRDSALILYSLMTIGYQEEATDFFHWLGKTQRQDPTGLPQIMYTIDGGRKLPEVVLGNLEGYMCSRPVRVGNQAAAQLQLDIFGEVLTAADLHFGTGIGQAEARAKGAPEGARPSNVTWKLISRLVELAAAHWKEPDRGIWEVRGGSQLFLYSRLMCWAALDRGIRLAKGCGLPAPVDSWTTTRDEIRQAILTRGYDAGLGAFTQAFGSRALDASALAIPRIGFLPATDPRVKSTVDLIQRKLLKNGLVYRYLSEDGVPGGESSFVLCTFWLVDALAMGGRLDEARELFEHTIGYANDVGLMSEEIDPAGGELLGNFPQGFTHLALVRSAVNLAKASAHGPETHAETEAERADRAKPAASEESRGQEKVRRSA